MGRYQRSNRWVDVVNDQKVEKMGNTLLFHVLLSYMHVSLYQDGPSIFLFDPLEGCGALISMCYSSFLLVHCLVGGKVLYATGSRHIIFPVGETCHFRIRFLDHGEFYLETRILR